MTILIINRNKEPVSHLHIPVTVRYALCSVTPNLFLATQVYWPSSSGMIPV